MDTIANMLTSIRNAIIINKENIIIPFSKQKTKILDNLKKLEYIEDYKINELKNNKKNIKILLKYINNKSALTNIRQISKPGLRVYVSYKNIPSVLGGAGDSILSTPKGIMSGKNAKKQKVGGELICEVY